MCYSVKETQSTWSVNWGSFCRKSEKISENLANKNVRTFKKIICNFHIMTNSADYSEYQTT